MITYYVIGQGALLLLADPCCTGLPFLLLFYKLFYSVVSTELLNMFMKSISALQVAFQGDLLQRRTEKGVQSILDLPFDFFTEAKMAVSMEHRWKGLVSVVSVTLLLFERKPNGNYEAKKTKKLQKKLSGLCESYVGSFSNR